MKRTKYYFDKTFSFLMFDGYIKIYVVNNMIEFIYVHQGIRNCIYSSYIQDVPYVLQFKKIFL